MSRVDPRTLLLVEDEPMLRQVLVRYLRKQGHDVSDVGDAEAALHLYRQQHFHAVIADVHLPGMNGIELAFAIREISSDQPIVFVTGDLDEGLARAALAHEGAGYLLKPFEFFELDVALRQAIGTMASPPPPSARPASATPQAYAADDAWRVEQRRLLEAAARQPVELRVRSSPREPRRSRGRLVLNIIIALGLMLLAAWGIGYWIASHSHRSDQQPPAGQPGGAGTIYVPAAPTPPPRERGPDRR